MKDLPPIPFPSKDIAWNFLKATPSYKRRSAGRTVQVKSALKRIEEAIRERKEEKRAKAQVLGGAVRRSKHKSQT